MSNLKNAIPMSFPVVFLSDPREIFSVFFANQGKYESSLAPAYHIR